MSQPVLVQCREDVSRCLLQLETLEAGFRAVKAAHMSGNLDGVEFFLQATVNGELAVIPVTVPEDWDTNQLLVRAAGSQSDEMLAVWSRVREIADKALAHFAAAQQAGDGE